MANRTETGTAADAPPLPQRPIRIETGREPDALYLCRQQCPTHALFAPRLLQGLTLARLRADDPA